MNVRDMSLQQGSDRQRGMEFKVACQVPRRAEALGAWDWVGRRTQNLGWGLVGVFFQGPRGPLRPWATIRPHATFP